MTQYSIIIPVYNEAGNITKLHNEIKTTMDKISTDYEIIFTNDSSTDNSLEELKSLPNITIINFNRRYGQATALDAGFRKAKGNIVISMDGDGQNDPKDIPKLLKKMKQDNLDVVAGYRKNRADKKGIRILTRIGRLLRRILIKDSVHDTGCTLRAYKRKAIESLEIQGEMHRYILALLRWKGFKIGEVVVNDRKRIHGQAKYGYSKAIRGFIDLLYIWFIDKYSQRPLHIFGEVGIFSSFVGFLSLLYSIYAKIFSGIALNRSGYFFAGFFLILSGIIFFSFGIILDLLMKIYLNTSPVERRYHIKEIIET